MKKKGRKISVCSAKLCFGKNIKYTFLKKAIDLTNNNKN